MIIKYFSDIHLEFHDAHNQAYFLDDLFKDDLPNIFVVSGDLSVPSDIIQWLDYIDKMVDVPVLFVPGNHEYYGSQKVVKDEEFKNLNLDHVKILNGDTFKHMDVVFAGATGWWDDPMNNSHLYALNDFNRIYDIKQHMNGTEWGVRDRRFFRQVLADNVYVVCISHNAPSYQSINPKYLGSDINECFANHWDTMIHEFQPVAWIHGHMHDSCEYTIGKTQIVCNPYGYSGHEVNKEFSKTSYLEVL